MFQADDGGGFEGQDTGCGGGGVDVDDDDDDGGGVDFGLSMADDATLTQFVPSQEMDVDGLPLTGDNLLAVPRKVLISPFIVFMH